MSLINRKTTEKNPNYPLKFNNIEVKNVRRTNLSNSNIYVEYMLVGDYDINDENHKVQSWHRFSEFEQLMKSLRISFPSFKIPATLPSKLEFNQNSAISYFNNLINNDFTKDNLTNSEFEPHIIKRSKGLDQFLKSVLLYNRYPWTCSLELLFFVGISNEDINNIIISFIRNYTPLITIRYSISHPKDVNWQKEIRYIHGLCRRMKNSKQIFDKPNVLSKDAISNLFEIGTRIFYIDLVLKESSSDLNEREMSSIYSELINIFDTQMTNQSKMKDTVQKKNSITVERTELLINWGESNKILSTRKFGVKPSETERTIGKSNEEILHLQRTQLAQHENDMGQLNAIISRQKQIALSIGSELEQHNNILNEMVGSTSKVTSRLSSADKKAKNIN